MEKIQYEIQMEGENLSMEKNDFGNGNIMLMLGEMQGDIKAVSASMTRIEAAMQIERDRSDVNLREVKMELSDKDKSLEERVSKLEGFRIKALAVIAAITITVNLLKDGFITSITKVFPL